MTKRSYQVIFILLSCCILFILLLQGYWIRNFYLREKEAFDRNVYAALEKVTNKLQERRNLQALKMTYIISDGDTIAKTPSRSMSIRTESNVKVINHNSASVVTRQLTRVTRNDSARQDSLLISGGSESVDIVMNGKKAKLTVFNKNKPGSFHQAMAESPNLPDSTEIKKLLDKMITEIKVINTGSEQPDTIAALIRRTLQNQGIFIPFEFSMQKLAGEKRILAQSQGFSAQSPGYSTDLSSNKLINTNEHLLLQFPGSHGLVLAGIRSSLLLSVFFSLLILGVFYYVLRLLQKQKKLSEIKNDFVNNMTHELKTPIATISLAVDGMRHPQVRNDPARLEEYLRILKEENQKLNSHVERVLQLALLEKGELRLYRQPLNVIALIRTAIDAYALQIQQKKATVNFSSTGQEIIVNADELHLCSVFTNLLDNALKYSAGEKITIDISVTRRQGEVAISFKDNGIGIDAAAKEKVFEKFYRVQGGNLHDVKGFGLGLSYVSSVIGEHGGSIALHSEKGSGSEFIITLNTHEA